MKTKHTPGPWHLSYPIGHDFLICDCPNGIPLASVHESNNDLEQLEANAKLMATAPDLLEALNDILTKYIDSANTITHLEVNESFVKKALEVIQKATK